VRVQEKERKRERDILFRTLERDERPVPARTKESCRRCDCRLEERQGVGDGGRREGRSVAVARAGNVGDELDVDLRVR